MILGGEICYALSRRMVLGRKRGDAGFNPATFDPAAYQNWRRKELETQFLSNFSKADVEGKTVLDFGCGEGDLSMLAAEMGAQRVIGRDLWPDRIASARERSAKSPLAIKPEFSVPPRSDAIDLPDASVDVILCFDVLEHVMEYATIVREWDRVLRPGGKILIWWVPWYHPYGPHIESLVPVPWAHVLFSERALLKTCARIYAMPEFQPRLWDLDEQGRKKPNKWESMRALPDVNKLTMGRFETLLRRTPLRVARRRSRGFGTSGPARITHVFAALPVLREFFTSSVAYTLQKETRA